MEGLVMFVFGIAVIVFFLVLLFAVRRIREEIVGMSHRQRRILALMEAVIPADKKPPTKTCGVCRAVNEASMTRCVHCGEKLARFTN